VPAVRRILDLVPGARHVASAASSEFAGRSGDRRCDHPGTSDFRVHDRASPRAPLGRGVGTAAGEIVLAAAFVPVLLFAGLLLFGLFGHDPS
jgi:hypothetical protein